MPPVWLTTPIAAFCKPTTKPPCPLLAFAEIVAVPLMLSVPAPFMPTVTERAVTVPPLIVSAAVNPATSAMMRSDAVLPTALADPRSRVPWSTVVGPV